MSTAAARDPVAAALSAAARGFSALAGGQTLVKLLAIAFGLWVVRGLGSEAYGRYSAALAFASLFGLATGPGAASFGARELAAGRATFARLVPDLGALRVTLGVLVVPAAALAAWSLGRRDEALGAVALAALGLPLFALVSVLDAALVAQGRPGVASACAALRQVLFVAFGAWALLAGGGTLALLSALLAALFVRVLVTGLALHRIAGVRWERPDPRRFPALARAGWAFGLEAVADVAATSLPIAVLALCASDHQVGCFGAAFGVIQIALPLAQASGLALVPVLNGDGARALLPRITGSGLRLALAAGLAAAVALAAIARPLTLSVFGPAYAAAVLPLQVLAGALPLLLAGEVLRAALLALRGEARVARLALAAACVAAASVALLAPWLGALGAALGFVLTRLTSAAGLARLVARALGTREARIALGFPDAVAERA